MSPRNSKDNRRNNSNDNNSSSNSNNNNSLLSDARYGSFFLHLWPRVYLPLAPPSLLCPRFYQSSQRSNYEHRLTSRLGWYPLRRPPQVTLLTPRSLSLLPKTGYSPLRRFIWQHPLEDSTVLGFGISVAQRVERMKHLIGWFDRKMGASNINTRR